VLSSEGVKFISGEVDYQFYDVFTDPGSQRERLIGTSDPSKVGGEELLRTELGGTLFPIIGEWKTRFEAQVRQYSTTI
jgi:hypothetical protein